MIDIRKENLFPSLRRLENAGEDTGAQFLHTEQFRKDGIMAFLEESCMDL